MSLLHGLMLALSGPLPCGQPLIGDLPQPTPLRIAFDGMMSKLERDPYNVPNWLGSENFRVLWGDDNPITVDEAFALLDALERAWAIEIAEMGYPAPAGTEAFLLNVYIGDSGGGAPESYGAAGYYSLDDEGYPMLVMAHDTVVGSPQFSANTAAHEFYHAVQGSIGRYSYDGVSAWYWESTAMWMEAQVFPEHPEYAVFLFSYAYLPQLPVNYFTYPETGALEEYFQYGSFIFNLFVSRDVADPYLIRDTWLDPTDEPDPLVVMSYQLAQRGFTLEEVWLDHVARNVLWDYPDHDVLQPVVDAYVRSYPESANLVMAEVPAEGTNGFVSGPIGRMPRRYGSNTIRIEPSEGPLLVQVRGAPEGEFGTPVRWGGRIVRETPNGIEYQAFPFGGDTGVDGELVIEQTGDELGIWLVVGVWTEYADPGRWDVEAFSYEYAVTPGAGPSGTGGGEGTESDDAGSGTESEVAEGSSGETDERSDSSDDSSSSGDPRASDDGDYVKGCVCTSGSTQGVGLHWLFVLGFAARRRRRA